MILRFKAEKKSAWNFLRLSISNSLDTALLLVGAADCAVTTSMGLLGLYWDDVDAFNTMLPLQLLRLVRLYHVVLVCRGMRQVLRSAFQGVRALAWNAVFLTVVIFSIANLLTGTIGYMLRNGILEDPEGNLTLFYGSLHMAMYTMFNLTTVEGWNTFSDKTVVHLPGMQFFFLAVVTFFGIFLFQIFIAIGFDAFDATYSRVREVEEHKEQFAIVSSRCADLTEALRRGGVLTPLQNSFQRRAPRLHTWGRTPPQTVGNVESSAETPISRWFSRSRLPTSHGTPTEQAPATAAALSPSKRKTQGCYPSSQTQQGAGIADQKSLLSSKASEPLHPPSRSVTVWRREENEWSERLDLRKLGPIDVLKKPMIADVLQKFEISPLQAYDALTMYYDCDVDTITVEEFVEACIQCIGKPKGRSFARMDIRWDAEFQDMTRALTSLQQKCTEELFPAIERAAELKRRRQAQRRESMERASTPCYRQN
eukprot:GHVT01087990.1.p1 GENE.GHVT01087990.1~~GHVT01087990.1.p1  ORF type:complete len:482 (-),score=62.41 GHVT01087990.1:203-1648(-)